MYVAAHRRPTNCIRFSLLRDINLFLFVFPYSTGINITFKSLPLNPLNVGAQLKFAVGNGSKNERYQSELGVHRKMYRLRRLTTQG